jgi:hypothetical protein
MGECSSEWDFMGKMWRWWESFNEIMQLGDLYEFYGLINLF